MNLKIRFMVLLAFIFALGGALMLTMPARAADCTWTGNAADARFNTSGNWSSCNGAGGLDAPASSDSAIIPNGLSYYPNIDTALTLNSLNVASGARLTINQNGDLTLVGNANTVSGTLILNDKGILRLRAQSLAGASLMLPNNTTISGTLELSSSSGAYTPTLNIDAGTCVGKPPCGTLKIASTGILSVSLGSGGGRVVSSHLTSDGLIRLGVPVTVSGAVTTTTGSKIIFDPSGGSVEGSGLDGDFVNLGGDVEFLKTNNPSKGSTISSANNVTIAPTANLLVAAPGLTTTIKATTLINQGVITLTSPLHVQGDVTTAPGSIINFDTDPNAAEGSALDGDHLIVGGTIKFLNMAGLKRPVRTIKSPQAASATHKISSPNPMTIGSTGALIVSATNITTTINAPLVTQSNVSVSSNLLIAQNWTNSGGSLSQTNGNITFGGTAIQTLTSSTPLTFTRLAINNPGGVTFQANTQVNTAITLTTDLIVTSGNALTLSSDSTTVNGAGDVIGTVSRLSPGAGIPLAFNNANTLITFDTAARMDMTLNKTAPSGLTRAINRYYTLAPRSGAQATIQLAYQASEVPPTVNENNVALWRFDTTQSRWVLQGGTVDTLHHWVTLDKVNQFSDWAITDNGAPTAVRLSSFSASSANDTTMTLMLVCGVLLTVAKTFQVLRTWKV